MSACSFELTKSIDAVFGCDGAVVNVYFNISGEQAGRTFAFSRSEAAVLGKQIAATGEWTDFPISGVPVESLRAFGDRLHQYGVSGC